MTLTTIIGVSSFSACKRNTTSGDANYKAIDVEYPKVAQGNTVDTFFGTSVADPYRWLEDDTSKATADFVKAQNAATYAYLGDIPFVENLRKRMTDLYNYEKYSAPAKHGGKYYFFKNDGLQNQSPLYEQDKLDGPSKLILDPNTFSKDGTISIGEISFSNNDKYLAFALADGGSDWQTIFVRDLQTGKDLADQIEWVKFSTIAWQGDGFYYSRFAPAANGKYLSDKNEFHQVYYHKIGTKQDADRLVFDDKSNPNRTVSGVTTEDERFLIVAGSESTSGNNLYFRDFKGTSTAFTPVVETFESDFTLVDNDGDNLLVLTNDGAPNYRLISINSKNPVKSAWKTLIPEDKSVLSSVTPVGGKLVGLYVKDATSEVRVFNADGSAAYTLTLPELGNVGSISGKKADKDAFISFNSFIRPTTVYSWNVDNDKLTVFKQPKLAFNPDDFETKQIRYKSKDGTVIPMFITSKKGLVQDGNRPTLLYGYGGFNISVMPGFKPSLITLLENDGIYAVANIRGGGEYGTAWHDAGTKLKKQNVFDDFIAAAEFLIKEKYTSSKKLGIEGRSNGGLLIGACMTQRPDLFAVALPGVGVMDMLRYHRFTIGWAWATDYGRSDDSAEMFKYLQAYSPVHNCRKANYPATLVFTADHDDRVVPAHSFKFISALQAAQTGDKPCLIRIDTRAGHGSGKPVNMQINEEADKVAFLLYNTNTKVKY